MRYEREVVIDLPRERVIELFDNADNMSKWMPGLQSFRHLSGEPGQPGAKSLLIFDQGGRRIEMVETIIRRSLPDEFSGTYETKGVKNWVTNRFYEEATGKTRFVSENEFKFSGVMALIGLFMRGTFPKQTLAYMNHFKEFAENAGRG